MALCWGFVCVRVFAAAWEATGTRYAATCCVRASFSMVFCSRPSKYSQPRAPPPLPPQIPNAVGWYTGEALEDEEGDMYLGAGPSPYH